MSESTQKIFNLKVKDLKDLRLKYVALLAPILQLTTNEVEILAHLVSLGSFGSPQREDIMRKLGISSSASFSITLKNLCDKGAIRKRGKGKYEIHSIFLPENINVLKSVTFNFIWQTSSIPT